MRSPAAIRVRAHAKVNVSLRVLGRRGDGYHELRTIFQSLALHDTLVIVRRDGPFAMTTTQAALPVDRTNLVWRAADLLWRRSGRRGRPAGVRVHLVKRIPVTGGLGGGSSDAAAALRGLAIAWGIRLAPKRADALAGELGADVPYFLHGGTAVGTDRGDRIAPARDLPRRWVVLAVPPFGVSTREAFSWLDHDRARQRAWLAPPPPPGGTPNVVDLTNDLEPVVCARHPLIAAIKRSLLSSGAAAAAMSGSGSTVFGVFSSQIAANRAARRIRSIAPAMVTRFIGRRVFARSSRPVCLRRLPPIPRIG
jgi:4-diphosphocytidyl-2-C-methyl-D-erythritol kinase